MISMEKRVIGSFEKAEGDVPADAWISAIIKVACLFIIGLVIMQGVVVGANITADSVFYSMFQSLLGNIQSGYSLAALMVLAIGAASVLHFLGFM